MPEKLTLCSPLHTLVLQWGAVAHLVGTLSGNTLVKKCLTSASSCGQVLCCMPGYVLKSTLVKPAQGSEQNQSKHRQYNGCSHGSNQNKRMSV